MKSRRQKAESRKPGGVRAFSAGYFCFLLSAFCLACATNPKPTMLDLKVTNARIIDGTGAPWFRGDVGVRGDTIVAMGNVDGMAAKTTIDAGGAVVAPGFIDLLGQSQNAMFDDPHLEAKVRQG